MRDRRLIATAIVVLIAVAVGVRSWNIGGEPLWLDEAYSAYAADHGFAFLWQVVPVYETHPPFYYSLLHLWVALFGDSLPALRSFGWLAGIVTLPVVMLVAGEAAGWLRWQAPQPERLTQHTQPQATQTIPLVEMTRQVRPYPWIILCYASAIGLVLAVARHAERDRRIPKPHFGAYLLLLEALLWLHNLGALYGAALTVALLIALPLRRLQRRDWAWLAAGHGLVAIAYLPGLWMLRAQAATWTAHTWLQFRFDRELFDHLTTLYGVPGWIGIATLLLVGLAVVALARMPNGLRLLAMLATLALLPPLAAIAISAAVTPVFVTRIFTAVAVPALLLLALGAAAPGRYRQIGLAAVVLMGASMLGADVQMRLGPPMQDWYRTVDWLAARFQPGDAVFAYPNEGKLPLSYALRDKGLRFPIRAIPSDVPSLEIRHGTHPSGTRGVSSLPQAELQTIADAPETRRIRTIWLLRLGPETFDPGNLFLNALHRDRYIVRSWRDGPIDITGLRRRPTPARNRR